MNEAFGAGDGGADFFARQADHSDIFQTVGGQVVFRRPHRGLGNFSRQHVLKQRRQRHGEITVATIQFEQIATKAACLVARPGEHFAIYATVRLGKAGFDLLVTQLTTIQLELFKQPVALDDQFPPPTPANDLCVQFRCQGLRCGLPTRTNRLAVDQRDHQLTAHRRQKINLEQTIPQRIAGVQQLTQARHDLVNRIGHHRKSLNCHRLLRIVRAKHGVFHAVAVVHNVKLGT